MTPSPAARLRHDLRTPVNHILGYGEMLLEDAEATGRTGRAASLGRILDLAREMIVVIDGPATVRELGDSLRAPASRTIAELERLRDAGTSLGAAEAADLRRIADAAGLLLRFADEGAVVFGGDRAASKVAAGGNPEPRLLGRILIVDDDPANRELLGRRVEREGCAAVLAAGGAEAPPSSPRTGSTSFCSTWSCRSSYSPRSTSRGRWRGASRLVPRTTSPRAWTRCCSGPGWAPASARQWRDRLPFHPE